MLQTGNTHEERPIPCAHTPSLVFHLTVFLRFCVLSFAGAWGNYADGEKLGPVIAAGRTREGRVARRARRREAIRAKRAAQHEQRLAQRAQVRRPRTGCGLPCIISVVV